MSDTGTKVRLPYAEAVRFVKRSKGVRWFIWCTVFGPTVEQPADLPAETINGYECRALMRVTKPALLKYLDDAYVGKRRELCAVEIHHGGLGRCAFVG